MAVRAPHVVKTRSGFLVLRVFQMIFALMVLGGSVYGDMKFSLAGFHLGISAGVATLISLIYIVSATCHPVIYNYWVILALELFCFLFWIVAIAVLGYDIVVISPYVEAWSYSSSYSYSYYDKPSSSPNDWIAPIFIDICALIGVGGLEFIFFIISLSMFGVALAHHREAHCEGTASSGYPTYNNNNQDFVAEKNAMKAPSQVYQVSDGSSRSSMPVHADYVPYQATRPRGY